VPSRAHKDYYADKLSAESLRKCYEIAPPRVRQYLRAEIDHVVKRIGSFGRVLELGCGYGRVLQELLGCAETVVGVDTSKANLDLARRILTDAGRWHLARMDAARLGFADDGFDWVVCIQNGVSAMSAEPLLLLTEAMRVTRAGGRVVLSSYSDRFWEHRLRWFEIQSECGLMGKIDRAATGDGVIACQDGFRAGRFRPRDFVSLAEACGAEARITEVDESSVFCEIEVR
jgi:2-polyprenyl-6-hydroxyphenyl methylase/3-demethylubiquinone-9 3-methyltransferase